MKMQVQLFAAARQLVGRNQIEISFDADQPPTIADLRKTIQLHFPELKRLASTSLFAVDHEYASDNDRVSENQQVAMIPPVSGG
jgi:molybdopterin converting factor small subunit